MISAGLQLDVLDDTNIFLEREGGNMFELKDPFLTNLPFMQETHKNGKILSRQTLLCPHHSQLHIIQGIDPPKLLEIPKFTTYLTMSLTFLKAQFFQWDGNGGALSTTVGITVLVLAMELKLPN